MTTQPETTTVAGFKVSTANLYDHIQYLKHCIDQGEGKWVVTLNTEMLAKASREKEYSSLLRQADFFVADGMPLVWAANIINPQSKIRERTTGVDIVEAFLSDSFNFSYSIIGGFDPQSTISQFPKASERCKYLFNGRVSLSDERIEEFTHQLSNNNVQVLFIALGVPKQDKLASILRKALPQLIMTGVGGSFEILSKSGERAPKWMQNSGLEWMFRLSKDPKRMWSRYLLAYPRGIVVLFNSILRKK